MAVTFTSLGFGEAASGGVCTALAVTITAGQPVLAWVTSVNAGFTVLGVSVDPSGTPQFFAPMFSDFADGVSGDASGALWYLDSPVSGTFDIQVASNTISARRQVQILGVSGHDNSAPDAWRSGASAAATNITGLVHQVSVATTTGDKVIAFAALRQNSSAPNLTLNGSSTLVVSRLSGTTLRGIVVSGTDAASAVLGGTTATDTQSVLFGLNVHPYSTSLLIASPRAFALTGVSIGLTTGSTGNYRTVADPRALVLTFPAVTLAKTSAGALDAITLGTFPTSVQRLFVRATAIEVNSAAALNPTSGWTAMPGARSRDNALAMIVRGEFKVSTATAETSEPTIAAFGDSASVMTALVSSPSYVLTAAAATFAETGVSAVLRAARLLTASPATFTATGIGAGLARTRVIQASSRAFLLTGIPATLTAAAVRTLVASPAAFVLTASDVGLTSPKVVQVASGSFGLSSSPVGLVATHRMVADGTAVVLTRLPVALSYGHTMVVSVGAFTLAGIAVAFSAASLGTPLLWAIRGRVRPVVGESSNPVGLAPTLAPRRARAPAGNPALIELEVLDENGALVLGASGTLTITDEDEGGLVAVGLPVTYNAAADDTYEYRCITPNGTFAPSTRYRGDIIMSRGGQDTNGVLYFYSMLNDVLTD